MSYYVTYTNADGDIRASKRFPTRDGADRWATELRARGCTAIAVRPSNLAPDVPDVDTLRERVQAVRGASAERDDLERCIADSKGDPALHRMQTGRELRHDTRRLAVLSLSSAETANPSPAAPSEAEARHYVRAYVQGIAPAAPVHQSREADLEFSLRAILGCLETHIADEAKAAGIASEQFCPCHGIEIATARAVLGKVKRSAQPAENIADELAHLLKFVQNYCPVHVQDEIRGLLKRYDAQKG